MNPKIIDYMIASANDVEHLEKYVKMWIKDGWQPIGGVSNDELDRNFPGFYQAMVKYANK